MSVAPAPRPAPDSARALVPGAASAEHPAPALVPGAAPAAHPAPALVPGAAPAAHPAPAPRPRLRIRSIRWVVAGAMVMITAAAVVSVGAVSERSARRAL